MVYDTRIMKADGEAVAEAARLLKSGEVVAIPTETVYGLAANAFDENAVGRIFQAKGRPQDNPLIVHISRLEMLYDLAAEIPDYALKCAEVFWSGPLTMIFPKTDKVPYVTSGGLDTVGVRFPASAAARAIIDACGFPLAAPSANLKGRIPCIIDGGSCAVGVESTVIAFEEDGVRLLRPGFISAEELEDVVGKVYIDKGVTSQLPENIKAASPGMKYKHYSPKADITIFRGSADEYREYAKTLGKDLWCMVFDDGDMNGLDLPHICYGKTSEEQAKLLFDTLRELDKRGAKKVLARCLDTNGVGLAVYNRLLRAAAFRVVGNDE